MPSYRQADGRLLLLSSERRGWRVGMECRGRQCRNTCTVCSLSLALTPLVVDARRNTQEVGNSHFKGFSPRGDGMDQREWPAALFTVARICAAMLIVPLTCAPVVSWCCLKEQDQREVHLRTGWSLRTGSNGSVNQSAFPWSNDRSDAIDFLDEILSRLSIST